MDENPYEAPQAELPTNQQDGLRPPKWLARAYTVVMGFVLGSVVAFACVYPLLSVLIVANYQGDPEDLDSQGVAEQMHDLMLIAVSLVISVAVGIGSARFALRFDD